MKIFIIGNTASNLFIFRKDFIVSCVQNGYEVFALVSEYNLDEICKIKKLGANVLTYHLNRGGVNPYNDLKSMLELRAHINKYHPDIVLSFFTKPVIYGSLAAKISNTKKIVGMIEGLGSPFTEHPKPKSFRLKLIKFFQVTLYRLVFPFIDKIIFLNNDDPVDLVQNYNIKHRKNALHVLGGIGLNLEEFPYTLWNEKENVSFVIVARLLVEKGIYEFLEAAKIVKSIYPNVTFKVIGGLDSQNPSGVSELELQKILSTNLIQYLGFTNQIYKELVASAVFVLPSYREGVPRSTQEAMAVGRPIITTDVPGCRETVIDGVNGYLVPRWDVYDLVKKMCFFIENPEQINIMGKESYKIACEKFDVRIVNKKLFEILGIDE